MWNSGFWCNNMMQGWHVQEFQVLRVLEPALRMKAQADSNSRGRKYFICKEEKRKTAYWRMQGDPRNRWSCGSGWGLDFIAFFCIAWGQKCLSGADRGFLGRRGVSLIIYHLLGPPAVRPLVLHSSLSMVALTAVRDRKVYSVTASCWQGVMKGPAASGLTTTRGVIKGTAVLGHFHLHQWHL
jgi:hypothetical protein